jgi:endonuclease YncB( thermonuclease family)
MGRHLALVIICWTVVAQPMRTVDGDTFYAMLLPYPKMAITERVRVLGVNTPERKAPTMVEADRAKAFTEAWLGGEAVTLGIACTGQAPYDSFGRVLAVVTRDGKNLADDLIAAQLGVPMPGR